MTRGTIILLAALTLTGCASQAPQHADTTPSATTATRSTADTAYLTRVRANVTGADDTDLITTGKRACTLRGQGLTQLGAAQQLTDDGFTTEAAASIVTAATSVYCKQYVE